MASAPKPAAASNVCPTCHVDLSPRKPGPIVHCTGSRGVRVFRSDTMWRRGRVHHGRRVWTCPNPQCRQILGCDYCCGPNPDAILCLKCETYADGNPVGSGRMPYTVEFGNKQKQLFGIDRSLPRGDV